MARVDQEMAKLDFGRGAAGERARVAARTTFVLDAFRARAQSVGRTATVTRKWTKGPPQVYAYPPAVTSESDIKWQNEVGR